MSLPCAGTQVEAARALHVRLIDQNHFGLVLDALDCDDDRENVWARISELKKITSSIRALPIGNVAR